MARPSRGIFRKKSHAHKAARGHYTKNVQYVRPTRMGFTLYRYPKGSVGYNRRTGKLLREHRLTEAERQAILERATEKVSERAAERGHWCSEHQRYEIECPHCGYTNPAHGYATCSDCGKPLYSETVCLDRKHCEQCEAGQCCGEEVVHLGTMEELESERIERDEHYREEHPSPSEEAFDELAEKVLRHEKTTEEIVPNSPYYHDGLDEGKTSAEYSLEDPDSRAELRSAMEEDRLGEIAGQIREHQVQMAGDISYDVEREGGPTQEEYEVWENGFAEGFIRNVKSYFKEKEGWDDERKEYVVSERESRTPED